MIGGLFPNAWTIAQREYGQRVRSRSFLVVTALLAAIGLGLALMPLLAHALGGEKAVQLAVQATDARLAGDPAAQLQAILNAGQAEGAAGFAVKAATSIDQARADVGDGRLDGLLTITRASDGELAFDIYTREGPTSQTLFAIRSGADQLSIGDRLARVGISESQASQIFAPTAFDVTPVDPNATDPSANFGPRYVLAIALVILTFMAVVTYGSWVASSVVEEKSSRVMELLVTAATPRQLLAGKVLGTGAAGLTQYAAVVVAAIGGLLVQGLLAELLFGKGQTTDNTLQALSPLVLLVFGVFFLGGFALYSTLYAALGSTASRQEDVQTVTGPMILVGMLGYFVSFAAINSIDAAWVRLLSFVPFFSPYLVTSRLILGSISPLEILVSGALLLATLLAAQAIAARLYSAGVLLYGQRVGLRSVWRATRVHR
jgi:ABC-2 type transport system permease protein